MRYASVCSGIEAASVAWEPLGWKPVFFSEVEPFPCAVLDHHWSHVPNLGDMTKINGEAWHGKIDVLVGGTPCFTSGNMVLSKQGYIPIEDVKVGDKVVSHTGKLRSVVRVGRKEAAVGKLSAVGMPEGIICTNDHPFLSVEWRNQSTKRNNQYARVEHCGTPTWVAAENMPGKQWCARTEFTQVPPGFASAKLLEHEGVALAGWYLGDGWIRRWTGKSKKAVMLGLNAAKYARFKEAFPNLVHYAVQERTTIKVCICDTLLANWLAQEFGEKADGKRIPAWVLGHGSREHLLKGYFATDGAKTPNGFTANSVSKSLAYGVATLAQTLGYVGSVALVKTADTTIIEGRTVNQRDYYQCRVVSPSMSIKSRVRHGYLLRTVQKFEPVGTATVYNIEVEEDHSYIVNGAVVHNCQAFSIAGARRGLEDARGNLTLTFARLADAIQPDFVVWENVPGVLSDKTNAFGCLLGMLAGEDEALIPPGKKWTNAGYVLGPERTIAWRVLDAQYFGVAQRRRRVFLVACPRNGADPREILFEREGVRRDSAPSREAGQGVTCDVAPSLRASGQGVSRAGDIRGQDPVVAVFAFGGNNTSGPIDVATACNACASSSGRLDFESETFVTHSLRGEGFDASEDGTGRGTPLVPVSFQTRGSNIDLGQDCTGTIGSNCDRASGSAPCVAFDTTQITSPSNYSSPSPGDPCHPLAAGARPPVIAFNWQENQCFKASSCATNPLRRNQTEAVCHQMRVRRLTPVECHRLQGFPDHHCLIPWRNKPASECPDGPQYKALGNSMAVPCMAWIGRRIELVARRNTVPQNPFSRLFSALERITEALERMAA